MKNIILIIALLFSQIALADCNFKTDIKKTGENTYTYTKECHVLFGKTIEKNKNLKKQVKHLENAIKLKDLALTTADTRLALWRNESYKQVELIRRYQKYNRLENYGFLVGGIAFAFLSVWAAGQLK